MQQRGIVGYKNDKIIIKKMPKNKHYILLIIILLQLFSNLYSQNNNLLIPYLKNGKYGFANKKGKLKIKAKYSFAMPFIAGSELASVVKKNKPQIINRKGKIVLKNASSDFFSGTPTSMNVEPYTSKEAISIDKFVGNNMNEAFFLISATDKQNIFDRIADFYIVKQAGKVFLIDNKGKIKSKLYGRLQHIDNKLIEYCITRDFINNKYGLLNENGKEVLKCMYDEIVHENLGKFRLFLSGYEREFSIITKNYKPKSAPLPKNYNYKIYHKNSKVGIINKSGDTIFAAKYNRLLRINYDKFIFVKNDSIGIIDANEEILYLQKEKNFNLRKKTYLIVNQNIVFFKKNKKWLLINVESKQIGNSYDGVFFDFQKVMPKGETGVMLNNKFGIIDRNGKLIINTEYDTIYGLRGNSSFLVKKANTWSWLNSEGKCIYSGFTNFNYLITNYLLIEENNEWFYINDKGLKFKD